MSTLQLLSLLGLVATPAIYGWQNAQLTAAEDRQRMMDLLHLTSLRNGANGSNPQAPNYANYDESKANPYPDLPDALLLKNGKQVTKQLVGHVDNSAYPQITVDIALSVTTPANASHPVPVIMEFGYTPALARAAPSAGPIWQQQVLAKGWGYAKISPTSIRADNGAGLTQGIIGLVNKGQPRRPDDWGALRAWAWGTSRALDYFETDKSVDAKHVGIEGHPRYGKATTVTLAYDPRFAIAFVSSSGEGGATQGDGWVDAKGMFLAGAGAGPVYKLLSKKDMGTNGFPPIETPLIAGDVAFRQHTGGHTPGPNWPTFLTFASRYLN